MQRQKHMNIRASAAQPGKGRPSTYSDEWYTPPELVAALGAFDLDPCAGPMQHAAENWRTPIDGLAQPWAGRVWLNPPYSDVPQWLTKFAAHDNGIALVNARPDAKWFQGFVAGATAVMWLCGRVEFGRPDGTHGHPPVGSVLVAYGRENARRLTGSGLRGIAMHLSPNA